MGMTGQDGFLGWSDAPKPDPVPVRGVALKLSH